MDLPAPLDALILSDNGLAIGIVTDVRLIGVIELESTKGRKTLRNDRLVVIPTSSVIYEKIESLTDLPSKLLDQVEAFFALDSTFKGKQVRVIGRGGLEAAQKLVAAAEKALTKAG